MAQYATFTKFYSPEDAQPLISFLQQHGIPCKLEHEVNQLDKVFLSDGVDPMFALQIPTDRFSDLNGLLAEQAKFDMLQPGFEHVLQSSSTEELREILNNPVSWNAYDVQVAASLLAEKTQAHVSTPVNESNNYQPLKLELIWILVGYLISLAGTFLFYFGFGGFLAGLVVNQAKKTLKDGSAVKMYDKTSRIHGRIIMILGGFIAINNMCIFLYKMTIWGKLIQQLGK